jgi:phospholipid transport system substrate-binding protein
MTLSHIAARRIADLRAAAFVAALVGLIVGALIVPAARAEQAASEVVRAYQAALLDTMRQGKQLGYDGRYKALAGPVGKAFDLDYIAQRVAGPAWAGFNDAQKRRYSDVFAQYSIAQHASRFKSFGGERFEQLGIDDVGRGYYRVRTQLVTGEGERIQLDYLMAQRGGWRVVDVFAKGTISEVSTRRADFAKTLREGGVDALIREIDQKILAAKSS